MLPCPGCFTMCTIVQCTALDCTNVVLTTLHPAFFCSLFRFEVTYENRYLLPTLFYMNPENIDISYY